MRYWNQSSFKLWRVHFSESFCKRRWTTIKSRARREMEKSASRNEWGAVVQGGNDDAVARKCGGRGLCCLFSASWPGDGAANNQGAEADSATPAPAAGAATPALLLQSCQGHNIRATADLQGNESDHISRILQIFYRFYRFDNWRNFSFVGHSKKLFLSKILLLYLAGKSCLERMVSSTAIFLCLMSILVYF